MATAERGRSVKRAALAALVLYLLAFGALSFAASERNTGVVLGAALCMLAAAALLQLALSRARDEDLVDRRLLLWGPIGLVVVGAGLGIAAQLGRPTGGFGFSGACLAYVAGGQALSELRSRDGPPRHGLTVMVICAIAFAIGVGLCLLAWAPLLGLALLALLAAPVGLTLFSEHVERTRPAWRPRGTRVAPLSVLVGALLLWTVAGVPLLFTAALVLALAVLVGAIASSTQADVLLVAAVVALVWAASPRDVEREPSIEPGTRQPTLVALGDSYMSGEGAQTYFEGTNNAGVNECRRSPTAYAHRVVTERPESGLRRLAFLACSGDETADLRARQLGPLEALVREGGADVRLVVVSIGGNDAGFSTIGAACLAPHSCVERGQRWLADLRRVAKNVRAIYREIRTVVGSEVPVLAVPYPEPIRPEPCGYSLLARDEHRFISGYVRQLNRAIEWAADAAGFAYLREMSRAFSPPHRLRICDAPRDDIGVNFIALRSVEGVVDANVDPGNWIHNSLHPNERGHARMAAVLDAWLEEHGDDPAGSAPAAEPAAFAPAPLSEVTGDAERSFCGGRSEPAWCDRDDGDWAITQVAAFLGVAAIPALLVVGGLWLLWLPLLAWTRPRVARFGDGIAERVLPRSGR